jgi:hypothetical protein
MSVLVSTLALTLTQTSFYSENDCHAQFSLSYQEIGLRVIASLELTGLGLTNPQNLMEYSPTCSLLLSGILLSGNQPLRGRNQLASQIPDFRSPMAPLPHFSPFRLAPFSCDLLVHETTVLFPIGSSEFAELKCVELTPSGSSILRFSMPPGVDSSEG